ncbi:hypothetical protein QIS99_31340 [Streptomyces sp. B-S-A8]|uniref:ATP/GTP-binding protein n=1 Tax=Streptomyces solicavernae TaxID=3043614 RepID=A0ABT6S460_9ACTN|nr:hypothetical protein [Streptomyces sp. B-S-A8]MDI3390656.1 hypothetical protein [Streptomyces sp. B-S-A8]
MKAPVRDLQTRPSPPPALSTIAEPTTLLGWRARLRRTPSPPPPLIPLPQADPSMATGDKEEERENHPRIRYHADLGLVETTDIQRGLLLARRILRRNGERRQPGPHIAIDSDCRGTGKRTLLHHIGMGHQGRREKLHGIDDDRIPVVCINAPPTPGTPADWSAALATFLGWDLYRTDTDNRPVQRMKDFTGPAVHLMRTRQVEVCLVDGIDRLRTEDLQPTFDFFDYLADELSLTVFWSGIGSSDILREARTARFPALRRTSAATPLRQRSVPTLWVNRLPPRSREHPDEWPRTLASFDSRLHLCHHRPGTLLEHDETLYTLTDGLMEHLTPLISMTAQIAVLDGTEAITPENLHDTARYLDLPTATDHDKW